VPSTAAWNLGAQLDAHHHVETNGRMAVCRRCGGVTDGPEGHRHAPHDRQLVQVGQWLALIRTAPSRAPIDH
jgi:hypothetical protein